MQGSMTAVPVTHPTKTSSLSKSSASTLSATNRDASSSEARPSGLASTFSFANQSPTAPPSGFKQPLFQDKRAELSLSGLRNQQRDRSSILKKPATLPRNETLFALEQQRRNGAFVNDVLQNGRSRTLAPELRDVLGENGRDVDMTGTSTAEVLQTENSTMEQEASRCVPETPKSIKPGREQLPSPPPSQASFATRVFTPLATFKKPSTPASAGFTTASYHTVNPVSRINRAGSVESRATSFTFPGSPQHERETPVTPDTSAITRKRGRSINPGSDDESDWATSEPDSPLANKSGKDLKVNLGIKGARMHGGGHSKPPQNLPARQESSRRPRRQRPRPSLRQTASELQPRLSLLPPALLPHALYYPRQKHPLSRRPRSRNSRLRRSLSVAPLSRPTPQSSRSTVKKRKPVPSSLSQPPTRWKTRSRSMTINCGPACAR
jgi:hypothetical protein